MSIFGRTNVLKFDPDQPRDEAGKWTSDGGSSLGGRPKGYEFASPNEGNLNFNGAVAGLTSARHVAVLKASQDVDRSLGLDASDKSIIGAWADGAENSIMTTVNDSDYGKLKLAAAMKAHLANQKQALVFQEDRAGPAKLLSFNATGDLASIHNSLIKDGVAFHTLVPNDDGKGAKVYVVDTNGSAISAVDKAATRFNSPVDYVSGHAEFIGTTKEDGTDNEQRKDARRTYEGIIGESPVQGSVAKWQGIRNRWASTLSGKPNASSDDSGGSLVGGRSLQEASGLAAQFANGAKPLDGLPQKAIPVGDTFYVPGPIGKIRDVAASYMKSAGLPYNPVTTYQKVDEAKAKKIASAFDAMPNNPDDPATKASYQALAKEVLAQWKAVKAAGLKVDWIDPSKPDPYGTSLRQLAIDVGKNNHMWVFPTEGGFGSDNSTDTSKNPLLADSGEVINGHKCCYNDLFRIVHDYFGHLKEGNGFRAGGEDNAWRSHVAMFSDAAIPAMTSETRGQNSWVNFGPYGDSNQKASPSETHYAPQKIGLMPDWTWKT